MTTIITTHQYKLLQALSECTEITRNELQAKTGVGNGTYDDHMMDLRDRELVITTAKGRTPSAISITMAGQRALDAYIRYDKSVYSPARVPASRINVFAQPVYQPNRNVYFRNEGNAHIRSRGACA